MSIVTLHSGGRASALPSKRPHSRAIGFWLLLVAGLVFAMVVVGGITRLTESGLSIVEWRPVTGVLPPLTEEAWQETFEAYKQYPEYKIINRGMSLDEFKGIFWWEYIHRMLGRLIGFAFAIPFFYFLIRDRIPRGYGPRLWLLLLLGGAQGFLGWYMVQSGLATAPEVSHYRLTAHLSLAVLIFSLLLWTAMDLLSERRPSKNDSLRMWGRALLGLVYVQIVMGALVAGLKAGHTFNSWPLMDGRFVPSQIMAMAPFWHNFLDNTATVQFDHRMGAYALFVVSLIVVFKSFKRSVPIQARAACLTIFLVLCAQITLGVITVVQDVPVLYGTLHQAGALVLLSLVLVLAHMYRKSH